jgi:hypothetical protein
MATKQMTDEYAAAVTECRGNKLQTNQEIGRGGHLMANCAALTEAGGVRGPRAGANQGRSRMILVVSVKEV